MIFFYYFYFCIFLFLFYFFWFQKKTNTKISNLHLFFLFSFFFFLKKYFFLFFLVRMLFFLIFLPQKYFMFFDFYSHSFLSSFSFSSVVLFFNFVVFYYFWLFFFSCLLFYQEFKKNKNSSKNVHALFLVFFHFLLWKTVQNIVIEKQPCILKTLQAKQNKMKNAETKRLWHRQSKSSFKIRFMLGAAEGGWGTKRTATSSPVMCLQISVAYPSQPRISPHWFRCILHTACTLFLGADLKYNPPPYLRKLTCICISVYVCLPMYLSVYVYLYMYLYMSVL